MKLYFQVTFFIFVAIVIAYSKFPSMWKGRNFFLLQGYKNRLRIENVAIKSIEKGRKKN